ncbi:NACHT domain-containing protein [Achaetomium macrosporum]|uniref:NACHT domain-containing protein n=1 Tax=Achaetomium macrosporum TaxID=79813 RepID=A0AAN7C0A1_9PEZI|nr:NACHT domain-containing protein [Achaetomium macrosporum]
MPRGLRSLFQKGFHRHGSAKDREGAKEQEQDGCDVRTVTTGRFPASRERKDATHVSAASIDISRPIPVSEPTSPKGIPTATSTSTPRLPAAPPTDSSDIELSADADGATAGLPVRLWDRAYNDLKQEEPELVDAYEKILSRQLEDGPGSAVPESQPNTIAQNNSDARRRQMAQLIYAGLDKTEREFKIKEGLGVAVDVVLSARSIISSAIQAVPQAALPWTGICVALEMLANPITATEANRNGIDYVVKRMNWYWSLSSSLFKHSDGHGSELSGVRRELENQFVDLYKAFLLYQVKSVCCYYRNRGLVFLRHMVKLDDWNDDLNAIRDAENLFHQDSKAFTAQQTNSYLEQLFRNQMSEKDQQCLRDLRLTDPRDDKIRIEQTKGGLLPDSYHWILDNSGFQRWRDRPESSLLWIKGDPGKGKTMLLCGIVDELERGIVASGQNHNLAYFFCQATDSRINNAIAVLRGLIHLLVRQQPSLLSHLRKKYDDAGKSLFEDTNAWVALSDTFGKMLESPDLKTTYLIIDALDECVADLPKLLDFIVHVSSDRVKWLLSSRNEPDIERKLRCDERRARLSLELKRNAEQVSRAVDAFIDDKLSKLELLQDDTVLKNRVRDILHKKANGTFLWVALVVQELNKEEVESWHILQIVEELPPDLDGMYDRMLNDIKRRERDSEFCRRILSTATVAYRPLHLAEIGGLSGLPEQVLKSMENVRRVVAKCGSFLTIRDDQLYLIHQSARDYLSERASTLLFPCGVAMTHHDIFIRSLHLMSNKLRRDMYSLGAPGCPIKNVRVPDPDPLAAVRYSCLYWVDHLYHSVSDTSTHRDDLLQDDRVVHTFLKTKYLYWLEALSLLRAMSEGVIAIRQLEGLLVSMKPQNGGKSD